MIQIYINLNENIRKSENEGFFKILNEFLNFHPGGTHLKFLFQSIQKNLFIRNTTETEFAVWTERS